MRILYVEDNNANVALVERVIQMCGDHLDTFQSAESAIQGTDLMSYDVIITDIHLGENVMDGLDFTALLRQHGVTAPIVAITAYDFEEYERRSHEAGSDVYMVKPVSPQDLINLFDQFRQ